jgi:glycosyltransferase involved in cell wall biosynthesis
MRIVQITPGSGDSFYCENCLRDAALVKAMRSRGHDVLMVPLYLPLQVDKSEQISNAPIFFGGINVYLQQKLGFFRKTPRWVDRIFDTPALLQWVGRKAGMTNARDLGEATISMLRGEHGRQKKELDRLVDWLALQENPAEGGLDPVQGFALPDIVCLSNILLVGLAKSIKGRLNVPVVSMLQDEDSFLDGLASPYAEQAWQIISERASDVDGFIAVSKYYADFMQQRLGLQKKTVHVVYIGIFLEEYQPRDTVPEIPTIGFLSRMCSEKGLDTLVEAFIMLKKNERLKNTKLKIAGGERADDEEFINRIRQKLDSLGLLCDVEFLSSFDHDAKLKFFRTLSVLSVPERRPVAYGLYVLEALAAGVPVVQPTSGVFPELLAITGGGKLFEPNNAGALAKALEQLLLEPGYARDLGEKGREAVFEKFNIEQTAEEMVRIYKGIVH